MYAVEQRTVIVPVHLFSHYNKYQSVATVGSYCVYQALGHFTIV